MSEVGTQTRLNAVPEFSVFKDEYTITSGMSLAINHGLPGVPRYCYLRLKCIIAEHGYNIGDEVEVAPYSNSAAFAFGTLASNKTQILINMISLPGVTTNGANDVNAITAANWNLVVKAEF